MKITKLALSDAEIEECYLVMKELRPQYSLKEFVSQVKRQMKDTGYKLAYLKDGEIKAVGGFRIAEWLAEGKYMELEDLVSKSDERSKGFGGELLDWFVDYARKEECVHLKLVSHVVRKDAHRFYLNKNMKIEAHYFSIAM